MSSGRRTGLSRLWPYFRGKRGRLALVGVTAALSAAAPAAGRRLVRDAVDHGIAAGDRDRLGLVVLAYVGVNAAAWLLGTVTWLGLAGAGQQAVLALRRALFHHPP